MSDDALSAEVSSASAGMVLSVLYTQQVLLFQG